MTEPQTEPQAYLLRIYFKTLGGHTHLRVFTGKGKFSRGKAGDLTMTNAEFEAWKSGRIGLEFIDENEPEGSEKITK
jgi:hypothetical protein